ncbi:hypothetical protein L6R50_20380 [Myxococcota bacterium]|nr:hypothetical protein [Myxococcota bacterium]
MPEHRDRPRRPPDRPGVAADPAAAGAPGGRRPLGHVGGPARTRGEPDAADLLRRVVEGPEPDLPDRLTHPFHAYPGRMHPEVARRVLAARPAARTVLDPFVGGGTTLVEAMVAGREVAGVDINPVALLISRARTALLGEAERRAFAVQAREISERVFAAARRREGVRLSAAARSQSRWYGPHVLMELQGLVDAVQAVPEPRLRDLHRAVLSSILVKVSVQKADSAAEATPRQVGRGTASTLFGRKAEELAGMLGELAAAVPPGTPPPLLLLADARVLPGIGDVTVDLVLTSPPYPGTYDYLAHQARRLPWLGLQSHRAAADRAEIGARRRGGRGEEGWREEQGAWLRAVRRVLRPGGEAFVLLGDGVVDGAPWRADAALADLAPAAGLEAVAVASQERPHFHRASAEAFRGEPRCEHLALLRRP